MSRLRGAEPTDDADGCVSVDLCLRRLRSAITRARRRLLRVLFLLRSGLPAQAGRQPSLLRAGAGAGAGAGRAGARARGILGHIRFATRAWTGARGLLGWAHDFCSAVPTRTGSPGARAAGPGARVRRARRLFAAARVGGDGVGLTRPAFGKAGPGPRSRRAVLRTRRAGAATPSGPVPVNGGSPGTIVAARTAVV